MKFKRLTDILSDKGYSNSLTPSLVLRGEGPRYDIRKFVVSEEVQREADDKRATQKIAPKFNEAKMKVPSAFRDVDPDTGEEIFWVYDGQHTVLALIFLGLTEIPAYIIPFLSTSPIDKKKEMYEAFIGLNTSQVKVGWYDIHKGNVVIGDPKAVDIQRICNDNGADLCKSAPRSTPGALSQVKLTYTVYEQFKKYMPEAIRDMISIWPHSKIEGSVFHGYARLLKELYDQYGHRNHLPVSTFKKIIEEKNITDSLHCWDIAKANYIKKGKVAPYLIGVAGMDTAAALALIYNDGSKNKVTIRNLGV